MFSTRTSSFVSVNQLQLRKESFAFNRLTLVILNLHVEDEERLFLHTIAKSAFNFVAHSWPFHTALSRDSHFEQAGYLILTHSH